MIDTTIQFDKSSARLIDALGRERTATPQQVSRAFALFARNVAYKVREVMRKAGTPETGKLDPLSEMSKMLRPKQKLGGKFTKLATQFVTAEGRGPGKFWSGYITTVQRSYEVWQTGGVWATTPAQRHALHIQLARAAKRAGRKSTQDEHRKVSALHTMNVPERQVVNPLADWYAVEFPRQMRSLLLKQIEGIIKERKK